MRRLLVISHPAVLAVNQLPYAELRHHGWDPFLVTPSAWRNLYSPALFPPEGLPSLRGRVIGRRVAFPGLIQRHIYVTAISKLIAEVRPAVAFVEEEPTSVAAFQWAGALSRAHVPFGLQSDENLDRRYPAPAYALRGFTLARAAFAAARSPAAADLVHRLAPHLPTPLIPHHVPAWPVLARGRADRFVVGFAGRLVPEKGLDILIDAAAGIDGVAVRFFGNGPLREDLRARAARHGLDLEIDTNRRHEDMGSVYASLDVLVLPSRTTATWAEQFGRVLVEALICGVPVVGSDSGEIPWVIRSTRGGLVFPEGDVGALHDALIRLRDSPSLRAELGSRGQSRVAAMFGVASVAQRLHDALEIALRVPQGRVQRRARLARAGLTLHDTGGGYCVELGATRAWA